MDKEFHLTQYSKILDSSIDGIFALDREFKVILWSRQMERFSGLTKEVCLGKTAFDLFPILKKFYGLSFQKVLKGRVCILKGMPFNPALNNGLEDYYEGYYSPIRDPRDEVTGIMGVIRELGYRTALSLNHEEKEEKELQEIFLEGLTFNDVFLLDEIQNIQNSFSMATGVGSVIIDKKGNYLTRPSSFSSLCRNENQNFQCRKHLSLLWNQSIDFVKFPVCTVCGLQQYYVPIMVGKKQLALWIIGQVKNTPKYPSDAIKYAKNLDIGLQKYLSAMEEIPYMPPDKFAKVAEMLSLLVTELSNQSLKNYEQDKEVLNQKQITNQLININNRKEELVRIINKSPAIAFLWKIGADRTVSFVSENINQFGYSQEEFQNGRIRFSDMIYKEDLYDLEYDLREYLLLSREGSFTKEYRIVTKHGGMRWVQERSWPRVDEKGESEYLEGLLVDISVRKFAEEALMASEEQFKLLFERAPIGMALLTIEGEVLRINKAFLESIGYTAEEFLNTQFVRIVHQNDIPIFQEGEKRILTNKTGEYQVENRFVKKNTEVLHAITKIALINDAKGAPYQKLIQIVDITNRKKAENDLIDSQSKLQQAQSFAHLGNWELDISSSSITVSGEVYNIFGSTKKQSLKTLDDFLSPVVPNHKERIRKSFFEFLNGNKPELNEEYKIIRSHDGKIIAVQTRAEIVYNEQKKPAMALGTIQDITEMKLIEEELMTRNDELTNFVYKVSHDLRSPLLSIAGLLSLMDKKQMDDDQKKYISLIAGRVKRLDSFIMDILSHSKNLYTDIFIEKVDFAKIINEAFDDLAYLENASKITKQVNVPKKDFYSDQLRLADIFRNLISNAILYIHPSKETNSINIDISISERYASIVIEDNGLGIDKNVIPKIFNMFYRGIEISNGSGIGLYIVKQAVEKLGGNISVESIVSVGSKFFITLPNLADKKGSTIKCL